MVNRIGEQLGNYRLTRLLGQGGFADVYLAEHIHLQTQAAVKILYGKLTEENVQAFIHEAQTIAQLSHPHILRVLDFGFITQTLPYLVMDYAPGGTLRDRHVRGSVVSLPNVILYVKQVAGALAYAHTSKLIHRDVKPENMLLKGDGTLLLSDFGIVTPAHSTASMKTIDATGTVHYMAPEQIKGRPRPASDQYALAICVYEWLCGERPFRGDNVIEIAMRHFSDDPPSLCQRIPALPKPVEQTIFRALAKDPAQRFPDMLAFAFALEQAQTQNHSPFTASTVPVSTLPATQPISPPSNVSQFPPRHGELDRAYEQLCQQMKRREPYPDYPTLVIRTDASQLKEVAHLLHEESWIQNPEEEYRTRYATVAYVKNYPVNGFSLPAVVFKKTSAGTTLSPGTTYIVWIDIKHPVFVTFEEKNQVLLIDL